MRPLRILQIQTQAEAGGAQRVSDTVAEGLRTNGHSVCTAFMYRKSAAYDEDSHAIFISKQIPTNLFGRIKVAFDVVRFVKSYKPDAVITYQHYGNIIGAFAGTLARAHIVIANQTGNPGKRGIRQVLDWVDELFGTLGIYDAIIVNSASTEDAYRKRSVLYSRRLKRIDHGLHLAASPLNKQSARECFSLPRCVPLLVTTGRLAPGKNQDILIKALQALPEVHLALAGAGPSKHELQRLAGSLHVQDRVHFVGELGAKEIPIFLQAGDLFVFASSDETFGISVVEASVSGLPVATTDLPVLRDVLSNAEGKSSALFFPVGDHMALSEIVGQLLEDHEQADLLGQIGLSLAQRYSPERMVAAYESLLRRENI